MSSSSLETFRSREKVLFLAIKALPRLGFGKIEAELVCSLLDTLENIYGEPYIKQTRVFYTDSMVL